jgi:type II secretory pathway component PulK
LRAGSVERWWINSGHHRAPVLSALMFDSVPVRIRDIVDVRDVSNWPNVASGLFSRKAALRVVERLLEGRLPAVAAGWTAYLSS